MKNIAAFIPARSGSRGFKSKNIAILDQKPLFAHSILPAIESNIFEQVFLSSDSKEYLDSAREYGATPLLRKSSLAEHDTSMLDVVKDFSESHPSYDFICILYPTYPFRTESSIIQFVNYYFDQTESFDSMIGLKLPKTHPYMLYQFKQNGRHVKSLYNPDPNIYYRRQDYPSNIYEISHWSTLIKTSCISNLNAQLISENTLGYPIPLNENCIDIDSQEDFMMAKQYMQKLAFNINEK